MPANKNHGTVSGLKSCTAWIADCRNAPNFTAFSGVFRYHTAMLSKRFLGIPAAGLLAIAVAGLCLRITPSSQGAPAETSPRVDFLRDIQPVFQASCISCHGSEQQMAGLRLDSRSLALAGGQSGRAIEPGDADGSLLLQRVAGLGDQARMPMGGKPLGPETIELIREWIEQGADWPETSGENGAAVERHWAYVPPSRPELPKVRGASWVVNPIDAFVLARLEAQGLSPSPVADRVTLLRRLSLDLIGLPPTIDEVDAFLADDSSEAYRNQVERLLGSPHYGERWGRRWLDAARYADSDGFEKDLPRIVWFYRDWVIGALNRDLPYDRFIVEQLAGDMLPGATQDQMVATGYLRNSMMNLEGGIDPEQFRMEAMFDRMEAVGKGILGITIQCAQCHNHKYDPLTQEEYFRLFSFLNNAHEAKIAVYTPEEQRLRETLRREIRDVELELQQSHPDWRARMDAWERGLDHDPPQWTVVQPEVDDFSTQGQRYLPLEDGSFLAQGATGGSHRVKMTIRTDHRPIAAFRLELMTDGDLPMGGPGRSINGTCALSEFEVEAAPAGHPDQVRPVKMASATADIVPAPLELTPTEEGGEPRVIGPVALAIDGKEETAWGVDTGTVLRNQPRKAVFRPEQPIDHADGTLLTFYLTQKHAGGDDQGTGNRNLGRFRLSITGQAGAEADPLPKRVREILSIESARRTPEQIREVFSYWRTTVPEWSRFNHRIEDLWRQHPKGTTQLVLSERRRLRPTHVLARGDFLRPGKRVGPGVPAFLNPLTENGPVDRLAFARWLVDRKAPTTARTLVNRVWQGYFGIGLVRSSEDLGKQSEPPSHPKLLDWLAVEFMERGWSLKSLHRLIVTSATYRQSSRATPQQYREDPYNRLLARGPRFRVDAEVVRDIALAASGLLRPEVGGPSVYSPAPKFLFVRPASFSTKVWEEAQGRNRYRRGIYTFRYRSVPYPMLQTFDAPSGEASCVRRPLSNTPLQALTTLNEPVFLEAARALALRTLREGGNDREQRLTYAFRRCLARQPTRAEVGRLSAFLNEQKRRLADGWISPWDLAGYDPQERPRLPDGTTPAQLAAWTAVSRVLLNLDETISKE